MTPVLQSPSMPARVESPAESVSDESLDLLFSLRHARPHSILGIHPSPNGTIIRAWRVDARSITVLSDAGELYPMKRIRGEQLFEAQCTGESGWFHYSLCIETTDGKHFLIQDPYRFEPTVSELDLRLFAEGSHERIQEH